MCKRLKRISIQFLIVLLLAVPSWPWPGLVDTVTAGDTIEYYNPDEWDWEPSLEQDPSGAILYDPDDWEPYVEDSDRAAKKKKKWSTPAQADCILKHIRHTQSKLAIRMIIRACHEGYSRKICDCITDNMPGAENDLAARLIQKACYDKHASDK